MLLDIIAGTRPNFVKIAAILYALEKLGKNIDYRLIHTGQHYDETLSGSFFNDLQLPAPHINLSAGSGSQAQQTAGIMTAYEKVLLSEKPAMCIVVGDVNSSMACAVTAKKMNVPVAHVEAGIRSGDLKMPEEINRLIIDSIADVFFTTTTSASQNLIKTGKAIPQVHFVGNTMIDTLLRFKPKFKKPLFWDEKELKKGEYLVLTLHRPSNVDNSDNLKNILTSILDNSRNLPVIFPAHPRIKDNLRKAGVSFPNLHISEALSYLEFNYIVENAKAVITDSGGITEETTVLGIPCITIRDTTERPETVNIGTNELIGTCPSAIRPALQKLFEGNWKKGQIPKLWDGNAGERIIEILYGLLHFR